MTVIGTIEATGIEEVDIVQTRKEGIEVVPGIIADVAEAEGIDIRPFRCRFTMCNIPFYLTSSFSIDGEVKLQHLQEHCSISIVVILPNLNQLTSLSCV